MGGKKFRVGGGILLIQIIRGPMVIFLSSVVVAEDHRHRQNQHRVSDAYAVDADDEQVFQHVLCTAPHAMCLVTRVVGADKNNK